MFAPSSTFSFISTGNESLDKFLGKGFLNSSLNLFEREGPSSRILDSVWYKSLASSTISKGGYVIYINFNTIDQTDPQMILSSLPMPRKVKSESLYKDIRGKSGATQIKIAWRYSSRSSSPSDSMLKSDQVDFGLSLERETKEVLIDRIQVINVNATFSPDSLIASIEAALENTKGKEVTTSILVKDIIHPLSPLSGRPQKLIEFMYLLRSYARARLAKGMFFVSYDLDLFADHGNHRSQLHNVADCVVSFFSYETGQNILTGYKNIDGTLDYIKVPKINSFGFHFQRELSDWGYRFTKNLRFFVIDELSLPPCDNDGDDIVKEQYASDVAKLERTPVRQVGPLEDFKGVAESLLKRQL